MIYIYTSSIQREELEKQLRIAEKKLDFRL